MKNYKFMDERQYAYYYEQIEYRRFGLDMPIKDAAELYGCSYQQWQKWETGNVTPSASALAKIASVLHVPIHTFFCECETVNTANNVKFVEDCEQLQIK